MYYLGHSKKKCNIYLYSKQHHLDQLFHHQLFRRYDVIRWGTLSIYFLFQMEEPLEPRSDDVEALAEFAKPRGKAPFHVCMLAAMKPRLVCVFVF